MIKLNLKNFLSICIVLCIVLTFSLQVVQIQPTTSQDEPISYSGSYIIFKEGEYYIAKNVATDNYDFQDSSLSILTQNVVYNIGSNGGGQIRFLGGEYIFYETVYIGFSSILIRGDGQGTVLSKPNGGTLFYIGSEDGTLSSVNFEDLKIDGRGVDVGILYNRTRQFQIVNVNFNNFNKVGSTALYISTWGKWISCINIVNCYFYAQNGIKTVSDYYAINVIKMFGCNFFRAGTTSGEQIAIDFQNTNTFAIDGLPNISGYDIGVKLSKSSDSGRISGRFENNGLNIYIAKWCNNNVVTDWTSWNSETKDGSLNIQNFGKGTKSMRIMEDV